MADQTTNALFGIGKSLSDVVARAVSAADPLAQQELQMVLRYLAFLRVRVDVLYARARFELTFHTELAASVDGIVGRPPRDAGTALGKAVERGRLLLATAGASIEDLRACSAALAGAVSDVVRDAVDELPRAQVERAVVRAYEEETAFERSWYLPLGMDHFGAELAPIESYLSAPMAAAVGVSPGA